MPLVLQGHTALPDWRRRRAVLCCQLPCGMQLGSHAPPPYPGEDIHVSRHCLHSRLGLLYISFKGSPPLTVSSPASFSFLASFPRGSGLPLVGSQAQRVAQVAQGLLQTTVETLNVPARPPSPGTGQTQEVLHPILSKPHWKRRVSWACVQKTSGISYKLTVHCAYAEACTGTAAWQM